MTKTNVPVDDIKLMSKWESSDGRIMEVRERRDDFKPYKHLPAGTYFMLVTIRRREPVMREPPPSWVSPHRFYTSQRRDGIWPVLEKKTAVKKEIPAAVADGLDSLIGAQRKIRDERKGVSSDDD